MTAPKTAAPADDGWIVWTGGECPVEPCALVDVSYRSTADPSKGIRKGERWPAGQLAWYHDGEDDDIIAYRVVSK